MSTRRPECGKVNDRPALPSDTALYLIYKAVAQRRSLTYGRLHRGDLHCAMGCFFNDNPDAVVYSSLIEEVATVNDAGPSTQTPHERWRRVNGWLRWKIQVLRNGKTSRCS